MRKIIISENELSNLLSSPIFNMSLSSKELFHSNFLYWLALEYPDELGNFFADKCKIQTIVKCIDPKRENNNIDFSFNDENGNIFYIENKVKSLPHIDQLQKYTLKTKNKYKKAYRLLLSLAEPNFTLPEEWIHLTYDEYKNFLETLKTKNSYHNSLKKDYILLLDFLLKINDDCRINDDDFFDFHNNISLKQVQKLRLHDLYLKKKYENLSNKLYAEVKKQYPDLNITNKVLDANMDVYFESGMTRSQGLLGFKFRLHDFYFLIIQLQGDSYKMGIEYLPPYGEFEQDKAENTIELARKMTDKWFSFGNKINRLKESDNKIIYPPKKEFNKYGNTFYYKSIRLGQNISINSIIEIILEDIEKAINIKKLL